MSAVKKNCFNGVID